MSLPKPLAAKAEAAFVIKRADVYEGAFYVVSADERLEPMFEAAQRGFRNGWALGIEWLYAELQREGGEFDKSLVAGFDHPCAATCSGWTQGRERGRHDSAAVIGALRAELAEAKAALERVKELIK